MRLPRSADNNSGVFIIKRPLKNRCRILPAGGLGVSPSFKKSPNLGGFRRLIDSISAVSLRGQLSTK
jgi:hypothetical protein